MGYRDYSTAKGHIVDSTGHGDFTTITSGIAAAVSGQTIFIRPGTYTENPTLKAGVNLVAYDADATTPNVIINGKCTASFSGTASLSGINLQTNSDFALSVTGASATVVYLKNCYINATNNNAIQLTSSGGAVISLLDCKGNLSNTGIAFFTLSGTGAIKFFGGEFENGSSSTTASTSSSSTGGGVAFYNCFFANSVTTSNTSSLTIQNCQFIGALIVNGTGSSSAWITTFSAGSDSAISVGTGAILSLADSTIDSTNTNAITGLGTLQYGGVTFTNSSSTINTTTQVPEVVTNDAYKIITPGSYPYTTIPQDAVILVDTSSARTIIPLASPTTGQRHIIKDSVGSAATNAITVTPSGKNIDGVASRTINSNYGAINIIYNGTEWSIV